MKTLILKIKQAYRLLLQEIVIELDVNDENF